MDAIPFSKASKDLRTVVDRAQAEPVHITRSDGRDVVVMRADEYGSMLETLRIYASPANRSDLDRAIAAMNAGEGVEFDPTA
jgi:prevent-host-death family protein